MKKTFLFLLLCVFLFSLAEARAEERIAYSRFTDGYWQIWLYYAPSGEGRQATTSAFDKRSPAFSPDGSKLLLRSANGELWKMDFTTDTEQYHQRHHSERKRSVQMPRKSLCSF